MLFRKKKGMIDIRSLQRQGKIYIPKDDVEVSTNSDGFVDFGKSSSSFLSSPSPVKKTDGPKLATGGVLGFLDVSSSSGSSGNNFSSEADGYSKREVDARITELDNKIYKLEQRIELLERKAGVGASNSVGAMGW